MSEKIREPKPWYTRDSIGLYHMTEETYPIRLAFQTLAIILWNDWLKSEAGIRLVEGWRVIVPDPLARELAFALSHDWNSKEIDYTCFNLSNQSELF